MSFVILFVTIHFNKKWILWLYFFFRSQIDVQKSAVKKSLKEKKYKNVGKRIDEERPFKTELK